MLIHFSTKRKSHNFRYTRYDHDSCTIISNLGRINEIINLTGEDSSKPVKSSSTMVNIWLIIYNQEQRAEDQWWCMSTKEKFNYCGIVLPQIRDLLLFC